MSNNNNEDTTAQTGEIMDAVGSAMDGIGNSYSSLYTTLSNAVEKNIQMSEMFSKIMEQTYLANVKIASEIKPTENGVIDIVLTIHNASQFPIVSMTGHLDFDETKKIEASYEGSTLFEAPWNFEPHTKLTQIIHLKILQDNPIWGKGVIFLSFPHPITGKSIQFQHTFGIYVVDQLVKSNIDESDFNKFTKKYYQAKFVRDILEIHAIKGIDVGMCTQLTATNIKVVCEITNFSDDLDLVEIEFSGNPHQSALVSRLVDEFDALNGIL